MNTEDYLQTNSIEVDLDEFLDDPEIRSAFEDAQVRSDLADRLREARKSSGLSQKTVAKTMGTTQSAVSDFERGESDPQFSTIQRYARAVGAKVRLLVEVPNSPAALISPYRHVVTSTHNRDATVMPKLRLVPTYTDIKVS